jgi:hypothetical protein
MDPKVDSPPEVDDMGELTAGELDEIELDLARVEESLRQLAEDADPVETLAWMGQGRDSTG